METSSGSLQLLLDLENMRYKVLQAIAQTMQVSLNRTE